MLKEMKKTVCPFETMPKVPWHPGEGAKPYHVIQLNCGEVYTHPSCKIIETWKSFNKLGTKMSLVSNDLRLTANNSKNFTRKKRQNCAIQGRRFMYLLFTSVTSREMFGKTWENPKLVLRILIKNCTKNYEKSPQKFAKPLIEF